MRPPVIPTREEIFASGRALRSTVPRRCLSIFRSEDRNVAEIIGKSNKGRLSKLVPLKMKRMSASPFSFYRGAVQIMAFDLASQAVSGIHTQICGDAHLQNLGRSRPITGR
jgi:uncharacterized protein (DUF2252 family)